MTKRLLKKLAISAAVILGAAAAFLLTLSLVNRYTITFSIPEEQNVILECGDPFTEPEVTARVKGTVYYKGGRELPVEKNGSVDPMKPGEYVLSWTAEQGKTRKSARLKVSVRDTTPPVIRLIHKEGTYTMPGQPYEEEGFSAWDIVDGDLTAQVERNEREGKVYYLVSDKSGNTANEVRNIVYADAEPPVLVIDVPGGIELELGASYTPPKATATDNIDGDITDRIEIENPVDTSKTGYYEVVYRVKDTFGNQTEAAAGVTVVDRTAPVVTLSDGSDVNIEEGGSYREISYHAEDNYDGDITANVRISGIPDTGRAGVYTVTYTVQDSSGNTGTAQRTVYVRKKAAPPVNPGHKIVYLTFDDGPDGNTPKLLDILDKYNVKATFFVTAQAEPYLYLIEEEARRGHTVAIHTWTHEYSIIYSSMDAYIADLERMNDEIERRTGRRTHIFRFPGGSYHPNTPFMDQLIAEREGRGYVYYDWNVTSGDANGDQSTEQIVRNVINGIASHDVSVVLQHDIQRLSVAAVEQIIVWGLENGYTFRPLDENAPTCHFSR